MDTKNGYKKLDNRIFNIVLILLILSFFEESTLPVLPNASRIAILFIPLILFFYFIYTGIKFNSGDRHIILAFILFMSVQILGIRLNSVYYSLTQIYRSFSALIIVLYARHFTFNQQKANSVVALSALSAFLGIMSFILEEASNGNIFFGNLNTVGALFFILSALDLAIYFKNKKSIFIVFAVINLIIILISNTRTAFLLLLITAVLFACVKLFGKSQLKTKLFFVVTLLLLLAFVVFYYNITDKGYRDILNNISNALFNKNFDSGRPVLWQHTIESVGSHWFFGRGTGASLKEFVSGVENSHNSFLEIYLQNGALGALAFVICLLVCIKEKGKCCKNSFNIFIMVLAFILIFYNTLGVVLVKPRSGIGLLQWALLALPYADVENSERREIASDKSCSSGLQCEILR